jgi:hypothetical protein
MRYATTFLPIAVFVVILATPVLSVPAALEAQARSVAWTEVTDLQLPGVFGAMMARMPGAMDGSESRHGLHLHGRTLRQDDGSSSVLIDLDQRRYVIVDHEARTYLVFTFEEAIQAAQDMARVMSELRAEADESLEEARRQQEASMEELREAMEEAEAEIEYSFRIESEATGETRSFDGVRAQRHFLTGRLEARTAVEGVDEPEGGTLLFLVELWQSDEVPSVDEIYEAWGREMAEDPAIRAMGEELAASMEPMGGEGGPEVLALWDPRIAAGLAQLAEAVESLEGTTIRSSTTVALVPDGAPYQRDELLAWEPASMGAQLRAGAGQAAQDAGRAAARGALRGATRGVLGGRRGAEEPPAEAEEEEPRVHPLLRMTSEKRDIQAQPPAGPLDLDFQDYREIRLADLMEEMARPEG